MSFQLSTNNIEVIKSSEQATASIIHEEISGHNRTANKMSVLHSENFMVV